MYVAKCPKLGIISQGSTAKEALANLKEATDLYLEEFTEPIAKQKYIKKLEKIRKGKFFRIKDFLEKYKEK